MVPALLAVGNPWASIGSGKKKASQERGRFMSEADFAKAESFIRRPGPRKFYLFLVRFACAWALVLVTMSLFPEIEKWAIRLTIRSLSLVLKSPAVHNSTTGPVVNVAGVSMQIVADCSALMPIVVLWAAMVAFPASPLWKVAGCAIVAGVLWVFNILRILLIAFVVAREPGLFDLLHVYLWQTVTLILVATLFATWIWGVRLRGVGR